MQISSADVAAEPYSRVRDAIRAVLGGASSAGEVASALGWPIEHGRYALHAGRLVDWVRLIEGSERWEATPEGARLLELSAGSEAEQAAIWDALCRSPAWVKLVPELGRARLPTRAVLLERLREVSGLAQSTAEKRARIADGWLAAGRPASQVELAVGPGRLPAAWRDLLMEVNSWWRGGPVSGVERVRRPFTRDVRRRLEHGKGVAVRGPRQVGKSTAQRQLVADLLQEGMDPRRILLIPCDLVRSRRGMVDPILEAVRWYEETVLGASLEEAAARGARVWIFLDEVQEIQDWPIQIKMLVDRTDCAVYVTGSSALRLKEAQDSLAGRFPMVEVGPFTLREIADVNGLGALRVVCPDNGVHRIGTRDAWEEALVLGQEQASLRDVSFELYSERGGYPVAHRTAAPWEDIASTLRTSIAYKSVTHDLRRGGRGRSRDADLLWELFQLACKYAGTTVDPNKTVQQLQQRGIESNPAKLRRSLLYLDDTLLLRLVRELQARRANKRQERWFIADIGLRRAVLGEHVPLHAQPEVDPAGAGPLAENALATFLLAHQVRLAWRAAGKDQPEVDLVIQGGESWIPIEVKYRRTVSAADTIGLQKFLDSGLGTFGVLVTRSDTVVPPRLDPRIVVLPLSSALLLA
jgi:predicted AAA+ superfamily ATPase